MGLQPYTSADNDLILQAALCLNEIQIQLRGINLNYKAGHRGGKQIDDFQKLCFDTGVMLSRAVSVPISTKFHRTKRRIADHLYVFGCSRLGETDENGNA